MVIFGKDALRMGQMKKTSRKGFTVAELLIVVAVIAVLVSIAIPIYRGKLERAREAYDIYTMRQAASAAIDLYYMGIHDKASAEAAGLKWNSASINEANASGVYQPGTGRFLAITSKQGTPYGKGTKVNGKTEYTMGNTNGAYVATEDYTQAVILVSIYPLGDNRHVDVYWKNAKGKNAGNYVGNKGANNNDPKYSIRIPLN